MHTATIGGSDFTEGCFMEVSGKGFWHLPNNLWVSPPPSPHLWMIYQSWNAPRICPNLPHIMQAELISAGMRRVLTKILACWSSVFIPTFIIPNIFIYIRISFYSPLLSGDVITTHDRKCTSDPALLHSTSKCLKVLFVQIMSDNVRSERDNYLF